MWQGEPWMVRKSTHGEAVGTKGAPHTNGVLLIGAQRGD